MTDHNEKATQDWIKQMRNIVVRQESPQVSIVQDAEVKMLFREHRLVGIMLGMAGMLAYMVLLGAFPAVCG